MAHMVICATEYWSECSQGDFVIGSTRAFCGAYVHMRHRSWNLCGACDHMRHRSSKFCGTFFLYVPQKCEDFYGALPEMRHWSLSVAHGHTYAPQKICLSIAGFVVVFSPGCLSSTFSCGGALLSTTVADCVLVFLAGAAGTAVRLALAAVLW